MMAWMLCLQGHAWCNWPLYAIYSTLSGLHARAHCFIRSCRFTWLWYMYCLQNTQYCGNTINSKFLTWTNMIPKKLLVYMNCIKLLVWTAIPHSIFNWCSWIKIHTLLVHPFVTWIAFYHCFRSIIWHPAFTIDFDRHVLLILITWWNTPAFLLRKVLHPSLFQAFNKMGSHLGCVPVTQAWVPSQSKLCCCGNGEHSTIKWVWLALNVWHSQG